MMDLTLTLEAIERFEDATGDGLLGLFDGTETEVKSRWTIRRLRAIAQATGAAEADIIEWLQPSRLVESQLTAIVQMMDQLTPSSEAEEYLTTDGEVGESTGNSPPDAG